MKKFLSNTIVQLLIAVIIGLSAGFVVNDAVLEAIVCIKHITGQIIFFLVPLIILGFIAPSIAHLRSNASKMLLFAFGIAYLSSIGASFFGAAVGYNVIPFLHIADDANSLKALPENLLKIDIPPVMNVMTALVLAALIGLATAWVKSDEISKLLDTFQKMVLELVKRVLLPVLPVFIAANFCILSYQGAVTKQLPVFLSILIVVIVCFMLSARLSDERAQLVGELGIGHEVLYVEVHAVTPVVLRIGRDIDALGIGIGQTQALAHGKPVLKTQNAEHRRRVEMTGNDILGEPSWQRMGCRAFAVEHRVVVILRTFVVLVPPLAERGHIVAGYGTYRTVRVLAEMSEARSGRLGHALELEAEYSELLHHP